MSREVDASEPVSALADQDPTAADIAASLLSSPQQSFSACLSQGQKQQQADAELDAVAGEAGQPKQQQQPHCSLAPGPAAPEMQSEITAVQENRPDHGQVEAGRHPDGVAPLRPTQHTGSGPTACVLQVPATPAAPSPAAAHRPLAALSTSVKVRDRRCSLWRVFLRRRTACHGGSSSSSAHGSGVVRDSWECSEGMRPSVEAGHDGSSCGSSAASGASCSSNGSGRRGWWWSGRGSSHADDDPFDVESVDTFFDRPSYNLDMELSALGLQHQEQPHDQQDPKGVSPRAASYGADAVAGAGAVAGGDGQPQGSSRVILTGRWGWKDGGGALRRWGSMSGAASSPRSGVGAGTGGPGAVAVQLVSRFGELAAAVEALVELRAVAPGEGLGQGVAHAGPHTALGACSGALPLMAAPAGPLEYAGAPGSGDGGRQGFLEQQQQQQQLGYKGTGEVVAAGDGTPAGEAAVVVAGRAVLGQLLQLQEDTLAALLRKDDEAEHLRAVLCSLTASRAQAIQARAALTDGFTALQNECNRLSRVSSMAALASKHNAQRAAAARRQLQDAQAELRHMRHVAAAVIDGNRLLRAANQELEGRVAALEGRAGPASDLRHSVCYSALVHAQAGVLF